MSYLCQQYTFGTKVKSIAIRVESGDILGVQMLDNKLHNSNVELQKAESVSNPRDVVTSYLSKHGLFSAYDAKL